MIEEWKDIAGYEGMYQVSNIGNVKRIKHTVFRPTGNMTLNERTLIPCRNRKGYLKVGLHKDNCRKMFFVHQLVAIAFIENPHNYKQINHKNEIHDDNTVENLEWCDDKYNCNYGGKGKRVSKSLKKYFKNNKDKKRETSKKQANNRMDNVHIEFNGNMYTISELSEITGIKRSTISNRYYRGHRGDDLVMKSDLRKNRKAVRNEQIV